MIVSIKPAEPVSQGLVVATDRSKAPSGLLELSISSDILADGEEVKEIARRLQIPKFASNGQPYDLSSVRRNFIQLDRERLSMQDYVNGDLAVSFLSQRQGMVTADEDPYRRVQSAPTTRPPLDRRERKVLSRFLRERGILDTPYRCLSHTVKRRVRRKALPILGKLMSLSDK